MASNAKSDIDDCDGALVQRRRAKAENFAQIMIASVERLEKKRKKAGKSMPFTQFILQQAQQIQQHAATSSESYGTVEQVNRSLREIRQMVQDLDETHKSTSKSRRVGEVLNPFVNGIARYMRVVDTMVQSDPTVSALVWGGAKFVLQIAQEHSQHFETLTGLLEQLAPQLEYLGALSQCFDWSDEMTNLVMKSYETILSIMELAETAYGQSGLKTLIKGTIMPFDKKRKALMEQLQVDMQSLRDWAQAAQGIIQRKQREDDMQRSIDQWLQAPLGDTIYDQCIANHCPGTCGWLTEDPIYKNWEAFTPKTDPNSPERLLWINGPPGIGKTFLAASIIERLKQKGCIVAYYFFRDDRSGSPLQTGKGEAITFLRHIAMQLVNIIQHNRSHKLPTKFWDIYAEAGRGNCLSDIKKAVEVVRVLLNTLPRVHIVVDGLDECIDRYAEINPLATPNNLQKKLPWIIKTLAPLDNHARYNGVVKWLFTSCAESQLKVLFNKTLQVPTLSVTQDKTASDVMSYVMSFQEDMDESCEDDKQGFMLGLLRCIEMMNFLDARLTLGILAQEGITCQDELREALCKYNVGFNARYLRGLKVVAGKSANERELARKILAFVSVAERPLTINELLEGLAATVSPTLFADYSSSSRPSRAKFEELLSPLLELDSTTNIANPTIRFIHRTAREFILQNPDDIEDFPGSCRSFFMPLEERHFEIGQACLTYICYERGGETDRIAPVTLEQGLEDNDPEYAFMKYASIFWYHHLDNVTNNRRIELFDRIERFMCSPKYINCLWIQSLYAPYLLARYTGEEVGLYRINTPSDVFSPSQLSGESVDTSFYADPLPGWLASYSARGGELVHGCQRLIKEFGLVLLRRKGGIKNFHPGVLGKRHFTKDCCQREHNWRAIALESNKSKGGQSGDKDGKQTRRDGEQHLMTMIICSKQIVVRCLVVNPSSLTLTVRDWQIPLDRKPIGRPPKAKLLRETPFQFPSNPQEIYSAASAWQDNLACATSLEDTIFTGGTALDLLHASFNTGVVSEQGCGAPVRVVRDLCDGNLKMEGWIFQDRRTSSSLDGTVTAVMHRWINLDGGGKCKEAPLRPSPSRRRNTRRSSRLHAGNRSKAYEYASDSSFDSSEDDDSSDSSSEPDDSGYSSAGSTSHYTAPIDNVCGFSSLAIVTRSSAYGEITCNSKWHHYRTTKMPLRQSPPAVHPSGRFILFPLDGYRTGIIDNMTGKVKEVHSRADSNFSPPIAIVYHFTPPSATNSATLLHRLTATRDFKQHIKWNVDITLLDVPYEGSNWDEFDLAKFSSFKEIARGRVSWVSPYLNPFDLPNYPALPFSYSWTDTHLNIVFGACEVYVCRIGLTAQPGAVPPSIDENTTTNQDCSAAGKLSSSNSSDNDSEVDDDNKDNDDSDSESESDSDSDSDSSSETSGSDRKSNSNDATTPALPLLPLLPIATPASNHPIFLPASTTYRPFTFQTPTISSIEYALFAISGTSDLPPVLIFKDVEKDLGGWKVGLNKGIDGVRLGRGAEGWKAEDGEDDVDMKGKYSCNSMTYNVSIRSGMEWNTRYVVVCGGADL